MASLYEGLKKLAKKSADGDRRMALREQPPKNKAEARQVFEEMGKLRRELDLIGAGMEERIAQIRAEAEAAGEHLAEKYVGLEESLIAWAELNRDELTDGGKKQSANLGNGLIEWRKLPPSVSPIKNADAVIQRIELLSENNPDYALFIRVKKEVNKEAMIQNKELAMTLPGIKIGSAGESIEVTPVSEELAAAVSIGGAKKVLEK